MTFKVRQAMNNQLAYFRERLKYSQVELSEITGISRNTISNYETGKTAISKRYLPKLCEALKCTPRELLFGENGEGAYNLEEDRADYASAITRQLSNEIEERWKSKLEAAEKEVSELRQANMELRSEIERLKALQDTLQRTVNYQQSRLDKFTEDL